MRDSRNTAYACYAFVSAQSTICKLAAQASRQLGWVVHGSKLFDSCLSCNRRRSVMYNELPCAMPAAPSAIANAGADCNTAGLQNSMCVLLISSHMVQVLGHIACARMHRRSMSTTVDSCIDGLLALTDGCRVHLKGSAISTFKVVFRPSTPTCVWLGVT